MRAKQGHQVRCGSQGLLHVARGAAACSQGLLHVARGAAACSWGLLHVARGLLHVYITCKLNLCILS